MLRDIYMMNGTQKTSLYQLNEGDFARRMKEFCEQNPNSVQIKPCGDDRFLLKYRKKVFFKNLWTPEILECRGTIVSSDFKVHQRPFTKIFNLGEQNVTIHRDEPVFASRKVNGFMAAGSIDSDTKELLISTTGSTDSSFVELAKKYLLPKKEVFSENQTLIFEIVDQEEDPHVIKEKDGAYLLGVRDKVWNDKQYPYTRESLFDYRTKLAEEFGFPGIFTFERFSDLVDYTKNVLHEGFVVEMFNEPFTQLKLKSPFYSTVKWIGRMSNEKLNDLLIRKRPIPNHFDERFIPIFDIIKKDSDYFMQANEQERFAFLRKDLIKLM
jgi:hypothetical protein